MADTTYSTLSNDVSTYIADKTLLIAKKIVRFYDLADKAKLPNNNSKTFQYTRYDRLPLPKVTLTEGTTPTSRALAISVVSAVSDQWGDVVTITDVAELTIRHKPLQKAIELIGYQAAETVEREVFEVLMGGTNIYYPGTVTSRVTIDTTDVPTADTLRKIVAGLRDNGAVGLEKAKGSEDPELGDHYVGVVDSFNEQDVAADPDFIDAVKYASAKRLWNGEIGTFLGVRFIRSNMIPTLVSAAAATTLDNSADTGTITFNKSVRVMVTGLDVTFGYEKLIAQSSEVDTANDANAAHTISVTTPNNASYDSYNIYASAAETVNTTTTSTAMTLQASALAVNTTYKIGSDSGSASATRFELTTTGAAAPGQLKTSSSKIHLAFFLGKEAYTVVDLQNLSTTLTPATPSDSDPLIQRRKVGWKTMFKAVINNNNFFARLESESAYD